MPFAHRALCSKRRVNSQVAAGLTPRILAMQVPKRIEFVEALPRNPMGKVNKKQLLRDFFSS